MTRSLSSWMTLGLLCATFAPGCGSSSSGRKLPPLETLNSPNGTIEAGVDQNHEVRLVPKDGQEPVSIGVIAYPRAAGRVPQSIRIAATVGIKVETSECKDEVCTIAYQQNQVGDTAPSISYEVLDSAGSTWTRGTLIGKVLVAAPVKLEAFTPSFGELQTLSFPIADSEGATLPEAPTAVLSHIGGGLVKSFTCSKESCLVEYTYNRFQEDPTITFYLQTKSIRSTQFQIMPVPEVLNYHDQTKAIYTNPGTIRLTSGVDYDSSWKRPARQIHVTSVAGIESPNFMCFENACIASNVALLDTTNRSFTYKVNEGSAGPAAIGAKVQLEMREVTMMPLLQEAFLDGGTETVLILEPVIGYASTQGVLANTIQVYNRQAMVQAGISIRSAQCDTKGICILKLNPFGLKDATSFEYAIGVDGYMSPKQTLKVVPKVTVNSSTIEFAASSEADATYEVTLEPDTDYRSWDGSPAQTIQVLSHKNLTAVPNFRCDSHGICRATVKLLKLEDRIGTLQFVVQTATGKSARVERNIWLNQDRMDWLNPDKRMNHVSQKMNETEDTFTLSFFHELDYVSIRPATSVKASVASRQADSQVTLDELICNETDGVCTVKGRYTASKGFFDLEVELKRSTFASIKTKIRIIRSDRADIVPNLVRFIAQRHDQTFEFVVEKGEGKGYTGKTAKFMKVVEGVKTTSTTVPCSVEGRCVFELKPVGIFPTITYSLVDEQGVESTPHVPQVEYPALTATFREYRVRSGDQNVTVPIIVWFNAGVELDVDAHSNLEGFKFLRDGRRIQITFNLKKGLLVSEKMEIVYRLKKDGVLSNTATLTLEGFPELSLKDNTVVDAKQDTDGGYTFEISYAKNFSQLPIPIVPNYFFELSLKFPETDPVKDSALSCIVITYTCTGTIYLKDGVKADEVHPILFLEPDSTTLPPRAFVKDSPFTVKLTQANP